MRAQSLLCGLLLMVSSALPLHAEQLTRDEMVAIYLIRLAEHIQWPNASQISSYHIHVIDSSPGIYSQLNAISRIKTLHGKPISVSRTSDSKQIPDAHIVYLSTAQLGIYRDLYHRMEQRPVLFITDKLSDRYAAMIDLVEQENSQIHFEINKANILNRGLGIHPDIILLGGTEIDVAELYKEGQLTLVEQEKKLRQERKEVEQLQEQSSKQKTALKKQQHEIEKLESKIASEQSRFDSLHASVMEQEKNLSQKRIALGEREAELEKQQAEILKREKVLDDQARKILEQDEKIHDQEERLARSSAALSLHKQVIILMMAIGVLIMVLTFTLWRSNRQRKDANEMLSRQKKELEESAIELKRLSVTDQLTGMYNRKHTDEVIASEIMRADRYGTPFSVVLTDFDFFKSVNDSFGHLAGDEVLKAFSGILKQRTRDTDIVGRWGGEEFLVICPETDPQGAADLAEELRKSVETFPFPIVGKRTASFGVATYSSGYDADTLVQHADNALYQAKGSGRNTIKIYDQ